MEIKESFRTLDTERVRATARGADPRFGDVRWSPVKSLWFTTHAAVALIGGSLTFSPSAVLAGFATTIVTLCAGHSVGFHRLLVHRSFEVPKPLEHGLVYLGTLVGMGGPLAIIRMHDLRDWAQRHTRCHPFYIDAGPAWRDALWQLHGDLKLLRPPGVEIEPEVANDRFYVLLQRYWMLAQWPLAAALYAAGGPAFVIWGVSVRITVSLLGHWAVGYLAHNRGEAPRVQTGHAVQGRNVPWLGLLTMGEAHHNNHHAFPESARLGLESGQADPGWWLIRTLEALGLAHAVRGPGGHASSPRDHARHADVFLSEP